jgi:septum formation protein
MTGLILASQSRVRADLLRAAGVEFETRSPGVDEDAVKTELSHATPREIAGALADRKALALAGYGSGEALVIGADQTLEYEGRLFDKSATREEAQARLWLLRGRTHNLHSAVSLARGGKVLWRETDTASLTMRDFSDAWLEGYLDRNPGVLSSVGCYQLEGEGVQLFSRIDGDYFAILGLPLTGLLEALRREGALAS